MKVRTGFTLVELVVVILVLGILAAVAAPRLFDVSGNATDNGLGQTLAVIRDAIGLYEAENGRLPGADANQNTFKSEIAPFLRATFPECVVGTDPAKRDWIKMESGGLPLSGAIGGGQGWIYDHTTGEFRANSNALASDGTTKYSEF